MLLDGKREDVELAWLRYRGARARFDAVSQQSNRCCRHYFTRPQSLLWPFAIGILTARFRRSAPAALEATSIALSLAKVAGKAFPLIRQYIS